VNWSLSYQKNERGQLIKPILLIALLNKRCDLVSSFLLAKFQNFSIFFLKNHRDITFIFTAALTKNCKQKESQLKLQHIFNLQISNIKKSNNISPYFYYI
jgi:hypothetical protein